MADKMRQLIRVRKMVITTQMMYRVYGDEGHRRLLHDLEKIYDDLLSKLKYEQAQARMKQIRVLPRYQVSDIETVFTLL